MKLNKLILKNKKGFTIIELLIATSVFAVVLLIATAGVVFVSKSFIKGDVEAQTQDTARSILLQISQDIQFSKLSTINVNTGGQYYCIGNHVYVFKLNAEVSNRSGSGYTPHALLVFDANCPSSPLSSRAVGYVNDLNLPNGGGNSANELLAQNLRLGQLCIQNIGADRYSVTVTLAYGDQSVINVTAKNCPSLTPPSGYSYSCVGSEFGGQFCAYSTLTTSIISRIP